MIKEDGMVDRSRDDPSYLTPTQAAFLLRCADEFYIDDEHARILPLTKDDRDYFGPHATRQNLIDQQTDRLTLARFDRNEVGPSTVRQISHPDLTYGLAHVPITGYDLNEHLSPTSTDDRSMPTHLTPFLAPNYSYGMDDDT